MSDLKDTIKIFDTTLRDGEQTPGVSITPEQKIAIASKLDDLGVDIIEAGFPIVSHGEMKARAKSRDMWFGSYSSG
jgi:2-isopropylmalate synthase